MRIYDSKVNHLVCPLGFRMEETVFSWKVDEAQGKEQEAARIVVYGDAAPFRGSGSADQRDPAVPFPGIQAAGQCDQKARRGDTAPSMDVCAAGPEDQAVRHGTVLADTGWCVDADCLGTRVDFALQPRTRYYWEVFVRSDAGEEASSGLQWFETGKREEPWQGRWITDQAAGTARADSTGDLQTPACSEDVKATGSTARSEENEAAAGDAKMPGAGALGDAAPGRRHPYFEKEIVPAGEVVRARLYLCGLGLYEAFYNGSRIGSEYLTPYCNDYNSWVQVQTFDVTRQLQEPGTLSVLLGNGWYKERFGYTAAGERGFYGDRWQLIAELRIAYADGREEVIGTDESWRVRRSTITYSSIYDGEHRDDTLILCQNNGRPGRIGRAETVCSCVDRDLPDSGGAGGAQTGRSCGDLSSVNLELSAFDGTEWERGLREMVPASELTESVSLCDPPKGRLMDRLSLPVTVHEVFGPAELIRTPAGEQVFDLGQEFTGIFAMRVHEPAGTVVHIQTGEILQQGNFYRDNLRSAKSEYWYTSNGEETVLVPHFTFYGYRYVKIEGTSSIQKEDFRGIALYSDIEDKGFITTGHDLLNHLLSNIRWGLRSNFVDVPTDCPQRDERMGWTGDAQAFAPTAMYLTDSYAFYQKYLYDLQQEQKAAGGMVPNVIPSAGIVETSSVWGDACCRIPWNLYLFYGDQTILEHQYESMKAWVDYIRRVDGENHGWRRHFHYGDWLALDNPAGGAEQMLGGTDEDFIANIYYAHSARLVAKAAGVLGYREEEEAYRRLGTQQYEAVRREWFDENGRCRIHTQTALLLTLRFHLSDNEEQTRSQLRELFRQNGDKLQTGFVGTPILCDVLSDNGFDDLAWELLLNEEYPGWLREVKLGATTIWERWNSLLDDGTISGTTMNSMNHYAYGCIGEWIFRNAAGINVSDDAPGSWYLSMTPSVNPKVGHLEAQYDSPAGMWKVAWEVSQAQEQADDAAAGSDHAVSEEKADNAGREEMHIHLMVRVPFGCRATLQLPQTETVVELTAGDYEWTYTAQGI